MYIPASQGENLFTNRTPEGAARQLATVVAWLTECHLATLEHLEDRKSTSKYELNRQRQICVDAVRHCHELNITPRGMRGLFCTRLVERLKELQQSTT